MAVELVFVCLPMEASQRIATVMELLLDVAVSVHCLHEFVGFKRMTDIVGASVDALPQWAGRRTTACAGRPRPSTSETIDKVEHRVRFDLDDLRQWSVALDLCIVRLTVRRVLRGV